MARGVEDGAAVAHGQVWVYAQAQAFQHGGEVPRVDAVAVDRGGVAGGFESGAVEHGRQQRMAGQCLVEPGDGGGGAGECCRRRIGARWHRGGEQAVVHGRLSKPAGGAMQA